MSKDDFIIPRWLRLKEATQYGKIGKARLIELARSGEIKGAQDPDNKRKDWIFDRLSIDAYREAQMPINTDREIVLALLERANRKLKK